MPNERLRAALLEQGLTPATLAEAIGVDTKSVERWISLGRTPYRRHRYAVAAQLGVDETYLWPQAKRIQWRVEEKPSRTWAMARHSNSASTNWGERPILRDSMT